MLNRMLLVIASFAFVSMTAAVRANDIGVQVYIQPWVPQLYDQDHVRDFYHDPKKVSQVITDAWKVSGLLFPKLQKALADYKLPAGLKIAAVKLTSDPITDLRCGRKATTQAPCNSRFPTSPSRFMSCRTPSPISTKSRAKSPARRSPRHSARAST